MKYWRRTFLVLVALCLVGGCSLSETPQEQLKSISELQSQQQHREAMIKLKNLLQRSPDQAQARLMLGLSLIELGDYGSAAKELTRAAALGAEATSYLEPLGESYLASAQFQGLIDFLAERQWPDDLQRTVNFFNARANAALGNLVSAEGTYLTLISDDPDNRDYKLGLAEVLLSRAALDESEAVLRKELAKDDQWLDGYLQIARVFYQANALDKAELAYTRANTLAEENGTHYQRILAQTGLIDTLLSQQKYEAATLSVERLVAYAPNHSLTRLSQGRLDYEEKRFDQAQTQLERLVSDAPGLFSARLLLSLVFMAKENWVQAELHQRELLLSFPDDERPKRYLALTLLQLGRAEEALNLMQGIVIEKDNPAMLAMFGRAGLDAQREAETKAVLESYLEKNPNADEVAIELAATELQQGDYARVIELVEEMAADDKAIGRAHVLAVLAKMRMGDVKAAAADIERLRVANPDSPVVASLSGLMSLSLQDSATAANRFEAALAQDPNHLLAVLGMGFVERERGNIEQAKQYYQRYLVKQPKQPLVLMVLSEIAVEQGDEALALDYLMQAADLPDAYAANLMLARHFFGQGDNNQALKFAERAKKQSSDGDEIYYLRALIAHDDGDFEQSLELIKALRIDDAKNITLLIAQVRSELALGLDRAAQENLNYVLTLDRRNFLARSWLTQMALARQRKQEAREHLAVLAQTAAQNPVYWLLHAEVAQAFADYEQALASAQRAHSIQASAKSAAMMAQIKLQLEHERPEQPLKDWLATHPDDSSSKMMLAQHYQSAGANDEAIEIYQRLLADLPENPIILNNLAWLFESHRGDNKQALNYARQAYRVAPTLAAVMDTTGWLELKAGSRSRGLELLKQAYEKLPNDEDVIYHFAYALSDDGQSVPALDVLNNYAKRSKKSEWSEPMTNLYNNVAKKD